MPQVKQRTAVGGDSGALWSFLSASPHAPHYNEWTGKRCQCPWGAKRRRVITAGMQYNKLLKVPDKKLKSPEGQQFLRAVEHHVPDEYDALVPYLANRFKKGDIATTLSQKFNPETAVFENDYEAPHQLVRKGQSEEPKYGIPIQQNDLQSWHEWFQARQHPMRRGVDIMHPDFSPIYMNEKARQFKEEIEKEKERELARHMGKTEMTFPAEDRGGGIDWPSVEENEGLNTHFLNVLKSHEIGNHPPTSDTFPGVNLTDELQSLRNQYPTKPRKAGWHVKTLTPGDMQNDDGSYANYSQAMEHEGSLMGHCIGNSESPNYRELAEDGRIHVHSLRDPKGQPHVTWHYNSDGSLAEMFGPNDDPVKPEYQKMIDEWGEKTGHPTREPQGNQEDNYDEEVELPEPRTMEEYVYNNHHEHQIETAEAQSVNGVGPETHIFSPEPYWDDLAKEHHELYGPEFPNPRADHITKQFAETLGENPNHKKQFEEALAYHDGRIQDEQETQRYEQEQAERQRLNDSNQQSQPQQWEPILPYQQRPVYPGPEQQQMEGFSSVSNERFSEVEANGIQQQLCLIHDNKEPEDCTDEKHSHSQADQKLNQAYDAQSHNSNVAHELTSFLRSVSSDDPVGESLDLVFERSDVDDIPQANRESQQHPYSQISFIEGAKDSKGDQQTPDEVAQGDKTTNHDSSPNLSSFVFEDSDTSTTRPSGTSAKKGDDGDGFSGGQSDHVKSDQGGGYEQSEAQNVIGGHPYGFHSSPDSSFQPIIADTWDTREYPDAGSSDPSYRTYPKDCTCSEGHKLDCPVHGLNGSGQDDLAWSLPETTPVGIQQPSTAPRTWEQPYTSSNAEEPHKAALQRSIREDDATQTAQAVSARTRQWVHHHSTQPYSDTPLPEHEQRSSQSLHHRNAALHTQPAHQPQGHESRPQWPFEPALEHSQSQRFDSAQADPGSAPTLQEAAKSVHSFSQQSQQILSTQRWIPLHEEAREADREYTHRSSFLQSLPDKYTWCEGSPQQQLQSRTRQTLPERSIERPSHQHTQRSAHPQMVSDQAQQTPSLDDVASTIAHRIEWKPGQHGKWIKYENGEVHMWPLDHYEAPHHAEMVGDRDDATAIGEVLPSGELASWGASPTTLEEVERLHPAFMMPYSEPEKTWTFAKTAAETRTQQLQRVQAIEQEHGVPDTSKVVHQWPDGWSVRQPQTYADMNREGELMGNCFGLYSSDEPKDIWMEHPECAEDPDFGDVERPEDIQNWNVSLPREENQRYYSLRDPDNLPHASMDGWADDKTFGRHNANPKPEYLQRIQQWNPDMLSDSQHYEADNPTEWRVSSTQPATSSWSPIYTQARASNLPLRYDSKNMAGSLATQNDLSTNKDEDPADSHRYGRDADVVPASSWVLVADYEAKQKHKEKTQQRSQNENEANIVSGVLSHRSLPVVEGDASQHRPNEASQDDQDWQYLVANGITIAANERYTEKANAHDDQTDISQGHLGQHSAKDQYEDAYEEDEQQKWKIEGKRVIHEESKELQHDTKQHDANANGHESREALFVSHGSVWDISEHAYSLPEHSETSRDAKNTQHKQIDQQADGWPIDQITKDAAKDAAYEEAMQSSARHTPSGVDGDGFFSHASTVAEPWHIEPQRIQRIGKTSLQFNQPNESLISIEDINDPEQQYPDDYYRRPFIYHRPTNTVYFGYSGGHHGEMDNLPEGFEWGGADKGNSYGSEYRIPSRERVEWHEEGGPSNILKQISQQTGIPVGKDLPWDFTSAIHQAMEAEWRCQDCGKTVYDPPYSSEHVVDNDYLNPKTWAECEHCGGKLRYIDDHFSSITHPNSPFTCSDSSFTLSHPNLNSHIQARYTNSHSEQSGISYHNRDRWSSTSADVASISSAYSQADMPSVMVIDSFDAKHKIGLRNPRWSFLDGHYTKSAGPLSSGDIQAGVPEDSPYEGPQHQLNWTPGSWGKGALFGNDYEEPELHTWPLNEQEKDATPTHGEYFRDNFGAPNVANRATFSINPEGGIDWLMEPEENEPILQSIDPRLHYVKKTPWDFNEHSVVRAAIKTADKLHDFLMNPKSRPDLQTSEGQEWLQRLERDYHNDKTDALMPWLTREWKKGRIKADSPYGLDYPTKAYQFAHLYPNHLNHWADFMRAKNHPVRKELGDIMQHDVNSVRDHVDRWDADMEAKAQQKATEQQAQDGEIVHQWPDNWSVRRLNEPDELTREGDAMGHCVGSYGQEVQNGTTSIYSLRDPEGRPHATTEIEPHKEKEWNWPALENEAKLHNGNLFSSYALPSGALSPSLSLDRFKEIAPPAEELDNHLEAPEAQSEEQRPKAMTPDEWTQIRSLGVDGQFHHVVNHTPQRGKVVQIQGKSNQDPIPEYKQRLKEWFETMPEEHRPQWSDSAWNREDANHIEAPWQISEKALEPKGIDEYGLKEPKDYVNWNSLVEPEEGSGWNVYPDHQDNAEKVYSLARAKKEIPELAKEWEPSREKAMHEMDDLVDQNYDYMHEMVGPDPEFEDEWDQMGREQQQQAYKEYEDRQNYAHKELENEHGPSQYASALGNLLQPHYNPQTQQYENEPYADPAQQSQQAQQPGESWHI